MEWTVFLAFVVTSTLMDLTPGPAVLKVVSDGMRHGLKPAQYSIAGILSANAMYCAFSALGLSALLLAFPMLFEFIKWAGVAYLVWIGLQALRDAWSGEAGQAQISPHGTPRALFRSSFVLQGANPKSYLYFAAILPAFAPADAAPQWILILGAISILLEYPSLLLYSLLGGKAAQYATGPVARRAFSGLSGMAVIGAAAMVARTSLPPRGV